MLTRSQLKYFSAIAIFLCIISCVATNSTDSPLLKDPLYWEVRNNTDRFEEQDPRWLRAYATLNSKSGKVALESAHEQISQLGMEGHCPALTFIGDALIKGKYLQYEFYASEPDPEKRRAGAIIMFNDCAKAGYPPAIHMLSKLGLVVPSSTDGLTRKELREYAERVLERSQMSDQARIRDENPRNHSLDILSSPAILDRRIGQRDPKEGECNFDTDCGVGKRCIKNSGNMSGFCAKLIDEFGLPTFSNREIKENCSFDVDCPVGFRCLKKSGLMYGFCIK